MSDIILMDASAAREAIENIKGHLKLARYWAYQLYVGEGWKALGYDNFADCIQGELERGHTWAYRLLTAGTVEANLTQYEQSTPVDSYDVGSLSNLALESLSGLTMYEQRLVWEFIKQTAPSEQITTSHMRSAVEVCKSMMTTGALDDGTGEDIRVADVVKAAITEETYERLMRQNEHIKASIERKAQAGGYEILYDGKVTLAAYQVNRFLTFEAPEIGVLPGDVLYVTIKRKVSPVRT